MGRRGRMVQRSGRFRIGIEVELGGLVAFLTPRWLFFGWLSREFRCCTGWFVGRFWGRNPVGVGGYWGRYPG
jgi:hypothetical protein